MMENSANDRVVRCLLLNPIINHLNNVHMINMRNENKFRDKLLSLLGSMIAFIEDDDYLNILAAFNNCISSDDEWDNCSNEKLLGAKVILQEYARVGNLTQKNISDALAKLTNLGFDITPIHFPIEDDSENNHPWQNEQDLLEEIAYLLEKKWNNHYDDIKNAFSPAITEIFERIGNVNAN